MPKKSLIFLILITITLLLITGCTRSATRGPRVTPTAESDIPFPVSTQSQILVDILAQTQTAQAQQPAEKAKSTAEPTKPPVVAATEAAPAPAATLPPAEPEAEVVNPTATPGVPATYTVQADEFPFCIARRFNVDPVDLLSINGLNMDSYVAIGFRLTMPQSGSFPYERSLKAHPTDYTVQSGDTIGKIACAFGDVNPYDIYAVNGLEQGSSLSVGQVLRIP